MTNLSLKQKPILTEFEKKKLKKKYPILADFSKQYDFILFDIA